MSRCDNEQILNLISVHRLTNNSTIVFDVTTEMESCVESDFRNADAYQDVALVSGLYDNHNTPPELLECNPRSCSNWGAFGINVPAGYAYPTYIQHLRTDAREFAAGTLTFYAYFGTAERERQVGVIVSDISGVNSTALPETEDLNGDYYTQTFQKAGWNLVEIDLSRVPDGHFGDGWTPNNQGVSIRITVDAAGSLEVIPIFMVSTLRIFDSYTDFHTNETVAMSCLIDYSGDMTADITDSLCFERSYDESTISLTRSVTGELVSSNFDSLSPLSRKGDSEYGSKMVTTTRTVERYESDGEVFGSVILSDISDRECGFLFIHFPNACDAVSSALTASNRSNPRGLMPDEFLSLRGDHIDENLKGGVLFHESLIGKQISILYPQTAKILKEIIYDGRELNKKLTKMKFTMDLGGGRSVVEHYDRVLITSSPLNLTRENTNFVIDMEAQRCRRTGQFFRREYL